MCLIIIYKSGQSLVVWGITEGRQAAREVDTFLQVILTSDWSKQTTWLNNWPLIGRHRSCDQNSDLWLVEADHLTWTLTSYWFTSFRAPPPFPGPRVSSFPGRTWSTRSWCRMTPPRSRQAGLEFEYTIRLLERIVLQENRYLIMRDIFMILECRGKILWDT